MYTLNLSLASMSSASLFQRYTKYKTTRDSLEGPYVCTCTRYQILAITLTELLESIRFYSIRPLATLLCKIHPYSSICPNFFHYFWRNNSSNVISTTIRICNLNIYAKQVVHCIPNYLQLVSFLTIRNSLNTNNSKAINNILQSVWLI